MTIHNFLNLYIQFFLPALAIGYLADLIFGDPQRLPHPVRLIGRMITAFEKALRKGLAHGSRSGKRPAPEFAAGLLLVLSVLFCTAAVSSAVLWIGYCVHWIAGLVIQSWMCYTLFATKSLKVESMKVYTALKEDDPEAGRRAVSMIVGRDTDRLDESGVVKAAVETVAENASDGVIAPLFFAVIGGPVLGYFYKAANTMDSMVGYKNDRYRNFGTAAARLDDALNFLPARISALLMIGAAFFLAGCARLAAVLGVRHPSKELISPNMRCAAESVPGADELKREEKREFYWNGKNARRVWKRDRRNHASPNSAQTEAVMAGALGVQLAGDAWYFGEKHEKPTIGDDLRPVEAEDIRRANRLLYVTSVSGMIVFVLLRLFPFLFVLISSR
ncbi:MAG: adenosylcobinamide-phosphate synthase CbiB [Clostridiales bacterium]|nr:adenosylcobinamide-phosphate synthase CbiB [Clostridiales bacterium]